MDKKTIQTLKDIEKHMAEISCNSAEISKHTEAIRDLLTSLLQQNPSIAKQAQETLNIAGITRKNPLSTEEKILTLLHAFEIPQNIKGYGYITEAIIILLQYDDKTPVSITGELYPEIGERYYSDGSKVERAIRHAVEVAFKKNTPRLRELFPSQTQLGAKVTNSEFLFRLSEYIRKGI